MYFIERGREMVESCRNCKNWTNWKKSHEAVSDALSKTPTWDAKTAVLGRCTVTNKLTRGDAPICDKYSTTENEVLIAVQ